MIKILGGKDHIRIQLFNITMRRVNLRSFRAKNRASGKGEGLRAKKNGSEPKASTLSQGQDFEAMHE